MAHGVLPEAHNVPQGTHSSPQGQLAVATISTEATKTTRAKGPQGSGA